MLELLILALGVALPYRLWRRRHERRQGRISAAYERAKRVRLAAPG